MWAQMAVQEAKKKVQGHLNKKKQEHVHEHLYKYIEKHCVS